MYTAAFKVQAVLESLQRDTSPANVCRRLGVSRAQLYRWRQVFVTKVAGLFLETRTAQLREHDSASQACSDANNVPQREHTPQNDDMSHSADFKVQVVLESLQRDRNMEHVSQQFHISQEQLSSWRREFERKVVALFQEKRKKKQAKRGSPSQSAQPGETREDLKKCIRELSRQNDILKKAWGLLGNCN